MIIKWPLRLSLIQQTQIILKAIQPIIIKTDNLCI